VRSCMLKLRVIVYNVRTGVSCVVSNRTSDDVAGASGEDGGCALSEKSVAGDEYEVPGKCVFGMTGMDVLCDVVVCESSFRVCEQF